VLSIERKTSLLIGFGWLAEIIYIVKKGYVRAAGSLIPGQYRHVVVVGVQCCSRRTEPILLVAAELFGGDEKGHCLGLIPRQSLI